MIVTGLIFVRNPPQWRYPLQSLLLWPLIRLVTRSRYNHVALLCNGYTTPLVVEALGGGVVAFSQGQWQRRARRETCVVACHAPCPWLEDALGLAYDYPSLFWYKGLKYLTGRWHGPTWEAARTAVTCSELAAMAVGMPQPWDCSPGEVLAWMGTRASTTATSADLTTNSETR